MADEYLPPVTSASVSPAAPDGQNGYYISVPSVTLTRDEPGTTYYQWDSTAPSGWTTYAVPLTPSEYIHTLYYYSVDVAQNTESVQSLTFKVDTESPPRPYRAYGLRYSTTVAKLNWLFSEHYPNIEWGSGYAGYRVYDAASGEVVATTPVSQRSAEIDGLIPDTAYAFYVVTVDNAGNESQHSPTVSIAATPDEIVTIPDAALRNAVGYHLNQPVGDITARDMLRLTRLTGSLYPYGGVGASNLQGLEYALNLTFLDNSDGDGADLTPLGGLSKLTTVYLSSSQLTDLSGLEGLSSIEVLDLAYNYSLSDLSPLQGLRSLKDLDLEETAVTDLTPLQNLSSLERLTLWTVPVSDLAGLEGLTNLSELNLGWNQITDLTPLQGLASLETLSVIWNTELSDLTPLQNLTNLTSLTLYYNQVSDLTPLQGLTNLSRLSVGINPVSDLTPLEGLTNLTNLAVSQCQVSDLTPLQGLTNLSRLSVDINPVSDLTPLEGLTNLTHLGLSQCQVSDLTSLEGLANLTNLNLQSNQIGGIASLVRNSGLGSGDHVYLNGNFLDLSADSDDMVDVEALIARGVDVSYMYQNADNSPPTTTISRTPLNPDGANDWFITAPTVTLTRNESGTTHYQVDAQEPGGWSVYSTPLTTPEGDHTLYYYSVDTAGNEEAVQQCPGAKVDLTNPSAPALSLGNYDSSTVDLSWSASTDTPSGVSGYRIYRQGSSIPLKTVSGTSTTVTGLSAGTAYTLLVRAVDLAGRESANSNTVAFTTNASTSVEIGAGQNASGSTKAGASITFENVTEAGTFRVTPMSNPNPNPGGFRILRSGYYDIVFDGAFSGSFTITLPYDPSELSGSNESNLKLFHWKNGGWEDITVSVDTAANTITGRGTSFSGFGVGGASGGASGAVATPASSWWSLSLFLLIGVGVCLRIGSRRPTGSLA